MRIESLKLKQFRNYQSIVCSPSPRSNVFIGLNGQGKSNLLEAIYCLSNTRSFRTSRVAEMIHWGEEGFFVGGEIISHNTPHFVQMYYSSKKKVSCSTVTR